jgi:hypothetical protein
LDNEPKSIAHPKRREVEENLYALAVKLLGEDARQ